MDSRPSESSLGLRPSDVDLNKLEEALKKAKAQKEHILWIRILLVASAHFRDAFTYFSQDRLLTKIFGDQLMLKVGGSFPVNMGTTNMNVGFASLKRSGWVDVDSDGNIAASIKLLVLCEKTKKGGVAL